MSNTTNVEKRAARRRPILETFSIFVVIPEKGLHRLVVHDLSEKGIGFNLNVEGEPVAYTETLPGTPLDLKLYLNSSLYIPLTVQVVRVDSSHEVQRIGAAFQDLSSPQYRVFLAFLKLLDALLGVSQIEAVGT